MQTVEVSPAAMQAAIRLHREHISLRARQALAAKRSRGEKCGGIGKRPGHKVIRAKRSDGKMVKYWQPDRAEQPILRYIVWLHDHCVYRRRKSTLKRFTPHPEDVQVVTRLEANWLGQDDEWTNWKPTSFELVAGLLEKKRQRRLGDSLHRKRGHWDRQKCRKAYLQWFESFADNWPPTKAS